MYNSRSLSLTVSVCLLFLLASLGLAEDKAAAKKEKKSQPSSGAAADEKHKSERTFEGQSKDGQLQAAFDAALKQLDKALGEGGVADAQATWKMGKVTGQRGGIAGSRSVQVTITATRTPPWGE